LKFWEPIYKLFRSTKFAVVLVLYLAVTSALSTLVPQGKDLSFYYSSYSPALAWLIKTTRFYNFFKSVWFLYPLAVFFLNLLTCTTVRISKWLRRGAKNRFGPDIIHIGILLLMIGGILRLNGRTESMVYLREGDSTQLPGGYELYLDGFESLKYEDGRPKDWYSYVRVMNDNGYVKASRIEVNRPLRIDRLTLYQSSFNEDFSVDIADSAGQRFTIKPGDYYFRPDSIVVFRKIITGPGDLRDEKNKCCPLDGYAVFEELTGDAEGGGHKVIAVHRVAPSEKIDEFLIERLCIWEQTGLQVVEDRSIAPVLVSLILIFGGVSLTFIQKLGDKDI